MKIFLYTAVVLLLGISCANEDYLKYDTTQKDGVYLNYDKSMFEDSLHYTFGLEYITKKVIPVKVNLMGMPKNYKRLINFKIETVSVATEESYAAKEEMFSIPDTIWMEADSVTATIPLTINRLKALEDSTFIVSFNLEDSEDLDVRGLREYKVTFNDQIPRYFPWWQYKLGALTKNKVLLFFDLYKKIEEKNKRLYDKMVENYGEFLEKARYMFTPFDQFRVATDEYIVKPMYEEYLKNPDAFGYMPKPR